MACKDRHVFVNFLSTENGHQQGLRLRLPNLPTYFQQATSRISEFQHPSTLQSPTGGPINSGSNSMLREAQLACLLFAYQRPLATQATFKGGLVGVMKGDKGDTRSLDYGSHGFRPRHFSAQTSYSRFSSALNPSHPLQGLRHWACMLGVELGLVLRLLRLWWPASQRLRHLGRWA